MNDSANYKLDEIDEKLQDIQNEMLNIKGNVGKIDSTLFAIHLDVSSLANHQASLLSFLFKSCILALLIGWSVALFIRS